MAEAITEAKGIKADAAALLGVHWQTVHRYIKKYPTCRTAYDEAIQAVSDIARGNVVKAIEGGDVAESKWWLTKKDEDFKDVQVNRHEGPDGGPVDVVVRYEE